MAPVRKTVRGLVVKSAGRDENASGSCLEKMATSLA